jgi:hypothetical protein
VESWHTFDSGETIEVWKLKRGASAEPYTVAFEPTDPTNLGITNSGDHPLLSWTGSEPSSGAKHVVYRNGNSIATTAIGSTSYLDEDVAMGSGASISYKVRGVSGDGSKYSENFSNTVSIEGRYIDKLAVGNTREQSFALLPAWPNPFNPTTTIEYTLPQAGFVTLKVYNPLGEEVATLVEGEHSDGKHRATWDGSGVPSGVYFYRLTAGGYVEARKLLLMR